MNNFEALSSNFDAPYKEKPIRYEEGPADSAVKKAETAKSMIPKNAAEVRECVGEFADQAKSTLTAFGSRVKARFAKKPESPQKRQLREQMETLEGAYLSNMPIKEKPRGFFEKLMVRIRNF